MAFKTIETVKVNGVVGKAFNGYIYACNVSIGFSESPTKVTLNIVSEDFLDDFSNIYDFNLGTSLYNIEIGSLKFDEMSLISAEETYDVAKHFATLIFVDKSYILDKIFIGLINRHGREKVEKKDYSIDLKLMCEDCANLPNFNGKVKEQSATVTRTLDVGRYGEISKNGGYIILGEEEFVENKCDLPDINYNFTSLAAAIKQYVAPVISFDAGISNVDLNKDYRQAYIGTLREVLSNWCSDFGFSFYYDHSSKAIKFIDLRSPVNNVSAIKNILLSKKGANSGTSNNQKINYKKTIEDTYDQNHISYYVKASNTKNQTYNKYYPYKFSNLSLSNVFGIRAAYKNEAALYISCALAKYAPDFRVLYHLLLDEWRPLGITRLSNSFASADLTDLAIYGFGGKGFADVASRVSGSTYLITYSPDIENQWLDWERGIADNFLGKYHALLLAPKNIWDESKSCTIKKYMKKVFSCGEDGGKFATFLADLPFASLLQNRSLGYFFQGFLQGFWKFLIFEREAPWGTDLDNFISYFNIGAAQGYKPQIMSLDANQKDRLITALELKKYTSLVNSARANYDRIALAYIPSPNGIRSYFNVSSYITRNNYQKVGENVQNLVGQEEDCVTECEEDLVRKTCTPCNNTLAGFEQPSFRGLVGNFSRAVTVSFLGNYANIVFPVEALFGTYVQEQNEEKRVIPAIKEIYGSLKENLNQNTMGLQIIESNITNDFDRILNANNQYVLNAPFPVAEGDGTNISYKDLTPQDYHTRIHSKMTHSVTTPNESLSCEIIGVDFSLISNYLTPDKGLNSIDVSLDSTNGITSTLSFSNRPGILPRKEVYFKNTIIKNALTTIGQSSLG